MRMRTLVATLSLGALFALPTVAQASSHREAPFVTKNPKVDGTDFYMFNSYETGRAGFVTLIADYIPLQARYGGPNFFQLDPDALYEVLIDNTGDGIEDITFQFQFSQQLGGAGNMGISLNIGNDGGVPVAVPFLNVGDISMGGPLNVIETYTVNMVTGPRRTGASMPVTIMGGGATFTKPADDVGPKSYPGGYAAYAGQYVYNVSLPGCAMPGKVFVGQRAEPFAVNLGPVFDLIDAPAGVVTGTAGPNVVPNPLAANNITSIELELPASCITQNASQPVIAGWTTASVRQARVINPKATYGLPSHEGGAWTQVSRLSNPLVNEVVIGIPDKDRFNSSEPKDDAQFATYVTNPTLPAVINLLFGPGLAPAVFPRADLVAAFLTGVTGVNAFPAGAATYEAIRLNTTSTGIFAPVAPAAQSYLGAALCFVHGTLTPANTGCDPTGFPNGRRPGDDVVDIALDVMMGYLLPDGQAPLYMGTTVTPLTDGVLQTANPTPAAPALAQFDATFPYLKAPTPGANGNGT
jgi:hypothetical protein